MSDLSSLSSLSDDEEENIVVIQRRIYPDRRNLFEILDEHEFKMRFRLSRESVINILNLIGDQLEPPTKRNKAVCARDQLLLALRFYATASFHQLIGDTVNVNKSTVCRIVRKVSRQLASLKNLYIKMPTTNEEISKTNLDFYQIRGFPGVVGAIDCTHVRIQSPGGQQAERFRNRKGYFSINVQAVCNPQLKIMNIVARWPGSVHDSTIFNDSFLKMQFENGAFESAYMLGDSGYPCKPYLLTPFLHPRTDSEQAYNTAHIATRNTIERCFGVLKRRFPCLATGMRLTTPTVLSVIVACAVLHNLLIDLRDEIPAIDHEIIVPAEAQVPDVVIGIDNENSAVRRALVNSIFNNE